VRDAKKLLLLLAGLAAAGLADSAILLAQNPPIIEAGPPRANGAVLAHAVVGLKDAERAQYLYERIERVESRKESGDRDPQSVRIFRVIPAGTGVAKIPLGLDGKPADQESYRAELEKLLKSLLWAAETGQPQREAYQKIQKKQKDRDELIEATENAFLFTFVAREPRGDRVLSKYRMEPNPAFRPSNRSQSIFSRVRGFVWIDDESQQMARVEGEVTEDISLGVFLAKVYKGSRFLQDRYEMVPGVWLPSFTQYDFDGRKLFSSFAVHEKTFFSGYRRIGPPSEAAGKIREELAQLDALKSKSAGGS